MKRKFAVLFVLLGFLCQNISAQIKLWTGATYMGKYTDNIVDTFYEQKARSSKLDGFYLKYLGQREKLSKFELYVLEQALDEYNLVSGEFYNVTIALWDRQIFLIVPVKIDSVSKKGAFSYSWWPACEYEIRE